MIVLVRSVVQRRIRPGNRPSSRADVRGEAATGSRAYRGGANRPLDARLSSQSPSLAYRKGGGSDPSGSEPSRNRLSGWLFGPKNERHQLASASQLAFEFDPAPFRVDALRLPPGARVLEVDTLVSRIASGDQRPTIEVAAVDDHQLVVV